MNKTKKAFVICCNDNLKSVTLSKPRAKKKLIILRNAELERLGLTSNKYESALVVGTKIHKYLATSYWHIQNVRFE